MPRAGRGYNTGRRARSAAEGLGPCGPAPSIGSGRVAGTRVGTGTGRTERMTMNRTSCRPLAAVGLAAALLVYVGCSTSTRQDAGGSAAKADTSEVAAAPAPDAKARGTGTG